MDYRGSIIKQIDYDVKNTLIVYNYQYPTVATRSGPSLDHLQADVHN
jgi:hypothetical protein